MTNNPALYLLLSSALIDGEGNPLNDHDRVDKKAAIADMIYNVAKAFGQPTTATPLQTNLHRVLDLRTGHMVNPELAYLIDELKNSGFARDTIFDVVCAGARGVNSLVTVMVKLGMPADLFLTILKDLPLALRIGN